MKTIQVISSLFFAISVVSMVSMDSGVASPKSEVEIVAQAEGEAGELPLTVDDIRAVTDELEEALDQQDIESVLQYFAPFVISETITQTEVGMESVTLEGLEQHQQMLESSFGETEAEGGSEVEVVYEEENIRITPDGQLATLVAINISKVSSDDGPLLITTTDTVRMTRIDGQIKIISFTNDSRILTDSAQE